MMAEECTHDCSSCGSACASRQKPQSLLAPANAGSRVKRVIGVVSGKGGVGKSLVTGLLACETARRGKIAGVLDADITGPSMPRILGIRDKAVGNELGILPQEAENGVKVMSINLLLEHDTDPVIWRGSLIAGTVKQFWTDVCWGDVDCLYVDMPPGTGDVPLTVFQSLPVDGIVIVLSPQELVGMIVEKAVKMAQMMNIPVLGLVENMAYMTCPDCGAPVSLRRRAHGGCHKAVWTADAGAIADSARNRQEVRRGTLDGHSAAGNGQSSRCRAEMQGSQA